MEIKRKFELLAATKRRYTIRQSPSVRQTACAKCGEPMLTTEQAVVFFGITQRRVFQIIEAGAAHFTEIETGAVMVCLPSLAAVLDDQLQENPKFEAE